MDQGVIKTLVYRCISGNYREEILPYFNDVQNFLKFVIKNDGFKYIQELAEEEPHRFISNVPFGFWDELIILKPKETLKMISKIYFSDVLEMNGEYYYGFETYSTLSKFFSSVDSSVVYDVINDLPLDPAIYETYTNEIDYLEIIEELTFENKKVLATYLLKKVAGEELFLDDYQTVVFQDISFKQKNQDTFILTESNIMDVINDPDSIKLIIEKYTPELIDNLYAIANHAIKNLLYDDSFSFILNSLSDIFEGDIFEEYGVLHLKIKNFKELLSNGQIGNGALYLTLNKRRTLWKYYNEFYGGVYIEDNLDFYENLFDEINNIFDTSLV